MDDLAHRWGNLLVGNPIQAATLEFTLGPATLRFHADCTYAITGTDADAILDGVSVRPWWRQRALAGQTLKVTAPRERMRSCLAISGGIAVPEALGSRSTDLKAGFGGFEGRALRDGDALPLHASDATARRSVGLRAPDWTNTVRVLPGPEYQDFSAKIRDQFWRSDWQISPQSNRMGYRLIGPELARARGKELPSHGVFPGVIQVPPSGQPIVLMADAQTTGGYPKIGVVIRADLWKLAQARLGSAVRFVECTVEESRLALREQHQSLMQLKTALTDERPSHR